MFALDEGFYQGEFDRLKLAFIEKIPFYENVKFYQDTFESIDVGIAGTAPTFNVTMPYKYGGGEYSIIDFSFYEEYRTTIHTWIIFGGWFMVIIKIIKRLPNVIY